MPKNLRNPPIRIRVSDPNNTLTSTARLGRAVGFAQMKVRQLAHQLWRQDPDRTHLPARTYRYAMPASSVSMIEIKTSPPNGMWLVRIVGGSPLPAGILALPRNVDNDQGWVSPFEQDADPDAVPPLPEVELPGTPFQDAIPDPPAFRPPPPLNAHGIFRREGGEVTYIRDQDFRLFEGANLVDWRSPLIEDPVTGEQTFEILHWHAGNRYLPHYNQIRSGSGDGSEDQMETFFYDRSGTIKVDGPVPVNATGLIRGVALRNLLLEDRQEPDGTPKLNPDGSEKKEEYLCIVGHLKNDGYEVHARLREDPDDLGWRFLGRVGPFAELGNTVVVSNMSWNVPIHFNRIGTKACQINMTSNNANVGGIVSFLLEVSVNGDTVTSSHTNVSVAGNIESTFVNTTTIVNEPEGGDILNLPLCSSGGKGTATDTSNRTDNQRSFRATTQGESPIAADYKIDTDDEIGFISTSMNDFVDATTFVQSSIESSVFDACKVPFLGTFLLPDFGFFLARENITTFNGNWKIDRDSQVSLHMDGGRKSFTIGPLTAGLANHNVDAEVTRSTTRTVTSDAFGGFDPFPTEANGGVVITETESSSIATTRAQATANISRTQSLLTTELEITFADIRYGSMIVKHRFLRPESIEDNSGGSESPGASNPQSVGPVKNVHLSGINRGDPLKEQLIVGTSTTPTLWGTRNSQVNRTFIQAPGVSLEIEDVDEFYAQNFTSGGLQVGFIFHTNFLSGAENITQNTSTSVSLPQNAVFRNSKTRLTSQTLSSNVAVHDRLGGLFFNVDLPGADNQSIRIGGFTVPAEWDFTSHSSYAGVDPTVSVGMPPNEELGPQGDESNTTRPLFGPLVAVQNATIPPVVP